MWIFYSSAPASNTDLTGKTAIITGGNTGIGKETAKDFYKRGARVIIACRNIQKGQEAADDIIKECENHEPRGEIKVHELDLNGLNNVRESAEKLLETESKIHLLINNAGVMVTQTSERYTKDGFEQHFGVNHLGHFLFTMILLPKILESAPARIVNVSSLAHTMSSINFKDLNFQKRTYRQIPAYGQSKLANVLFSRELAKRLQATGHGDVTTYSLHPGVISTELGRNFTYLFPGFTALWKMFSRWTLKTPQQGALTTIHCAVSEEAGKQTGLYYR